MRTLDDLIRETHPDIEKLERERDAMAIHTRFDGALRAARVYPMSAEDIARARTREHILGRSK